MKNLTKKQLNEYVKVTCYNKTKKMKRNKAIEFYEEGVCCSEGSEQERYVNILMQLYEGEKECTDMEC